MTYKIQQISSDISEKLCRKIIADLPEYFGLPECNEEYAKGVRSRINFAIAEKENFIGLLSLDFPYPTNSNIYWMGILRKYQSMGLGQLLLNQAVAFAKGKSAKTMTVETLAPFESDANYRKTYEFYAKVGFKPLFNLKPKGYEWNMVYMIKDLNNSLEELIKLEYDAKEYGFDWPNVEMVIDVAISECNEIREAISHNEESSRIQEEIGDLIHAAISLGIFSGFDTEQTLEKTANKFSSRMKALKIIAKEKGLENLQGKSMEFMLELWKEAKRIKKV